MRRVTAVALARQLVPIFLMGCAAATPIPRRAPPATWPTHEWKTSSPEAQGLDSAVLAQAIETIHERRLPVHSVSIVRNGALVVDACFHPYDCSVPHDVASVTKSVTSLLVGIAVDGGKLGNVAEPALSFFPEASDRIGDPRKTRMRVQDLLTMQSGLACGLEPGEKELFAMLGTGDWNLATLALPASDEPGRRFAYCSGGYHLLSSIVSRATGMSTQDFARESLFAPLGITHLEWPTDPAGVARGWGDLRLFPRDMLELGLLVLEHGRWQDQQIVSERWIAESTRPRAQVGGDGYGYGWWLPGGAFQGVIEARGRGGQTISIWPQRNIVAALTGAGYSGAEVLPLLLGALRSDAPLPPNPEGEERLARAVVAARQAPPRRPAPALPPLAATISGKHYRLAANRLDLSEVWVAFARAPIATVGLVRGGAQFEIAVGLDGLDRISRVGPTGGPVAATGEWIADDAFRIHYEDAAGIDRFSITMRFVDQGARVEMVLDDPARFLDLTVAGGASPPGAVADP